jgi:hypothetical protein
MATANTGPQPETVAERTEASRKALARERKARREARTTGSPEVPANFTEVESPAELRYRAAADLADEFGTDISEWLV